MILFMPSIKVKLIDHVLFLHGFLFLKTKNKVLDLIFLSSVKALSLNIYQYGKLLNSVSLGLVETPCLNIYESSE